MELNGIEPSTFLNAIYRLPLEVAPSCVYGHARACK